jgi:ATP-dependent DNA helicase RecG
MADLDTISIDVVKGIGPARKKLLARLGIRTVADALRHFPRAYSDRCQVTPIARAESGTSVLIVAAVVSVSLRRYSWRNSVLTLRVSDDTGELSALWFNQPYRRSQFRKGQRLALFGKIELADTGQPQMTNPEMETLPAEERTSPHLFRIVPIYPATEDLSQHILRKTMYGIVERFTDRLGEFLPSATRERLQLLPLPVAIRNVHFLEGWQMLEQARRRLMFQKFLLLQLAAALRRKLIHTTKKTRPAVHPHPGDRADRFLSRLPFSLTPAQTRCVREIGRDLSSSRPMNRLLHGDVGCGKTIVAVWAILRTIASGYQASLMAPTDLLARQHYAEISNLLADEDSRVVLLVGSAASRENLYCEISDGRVDLVIGTQAIIQENVQFARLGLVVIDEQHRFGVLQRLKLYEKGDYPDLLVLSATPIPRTLCQTLYGDMDISVIDEMPPGRLPVRTECFPSSRLRDAYERLRTIIRSGNGAYVVCPTIEEKEDAEKTSAVETHRRLAADVFPDMRVGLLHGSMEPGEKEKAVREFRAGLLDILVATTVIEIGIDVPDAGAILITDAECFGLAQLHQMRGRVGRGNSQGYCLVVADPRTDAARERLRTFERTSDGFQIAWEDLKLRGVGEFFGVRQHGLPEIGIGNLLEHHELMQLAREEAFSIVNGDVPLSPEEKEALTREVAKSYGDKLRLGFV